MNGGMKTVDKPLSKRM